MTNLNLPGQPTVEDEAVAILGEISNLNAQHIKRRLNDRTFLVDVLYKYSYGLNYTSSPEALQEAINNINTISLLQGEDSFLHMTGKAYSNRLGEELIGANALRNFDTQYSDAADGLSDIKDQAFAGKKYSTEEAKVVLDNLYKIKKDNIKWLDPARRGMWKETKEEVKDVSSIIGLLDVLDQDKFDAERPKQTKGVQLAPGLENLSITEKGEKIYVKDKLDRAVHLFKNERYEDSIDELKDLMAMPDIKRKDFVKSLRSVHPLLEASVQAIGASTEIKDDHPELAGMGIGRFNDFFLGTSEEILDSPETVKESYNLLGDWLHAVVEEESTWFHYGDDPTRDELDKWLYADNQSNFKWITDEALTKGSFKGINIVHAFRNIKEAREKMAAAYEEYTGESLLYKEPPTFIKFSPPPSSRED